jgi:hypothetical protein
MRQMNIRPSECTHEIRQQMRDVDCYFARCIKCRDLVRLKPSWIQAEKTADIVYKLAGFPVEK